MYLSYHILSLVSTGSSISSNKPSILLAFWDILWYYGNRERKLRKGHIT